MKKFSKKYQKAAELVDKNTQYDVNQAVELLKKTSTTKFDSSCEVHFNLGVDVKQADQIVRSTLSLPHGTGKEVRVIAFVPENKEKEAKEAGAVKAGLDELIEEISKGWLEFDIAVATPDVMKNLGKIAKTLGTKGLMPNPKAGTVTPDIAKTVEELKKGRIEFRTDKLGQIHNIFGKVSFDEAKLKENLLSLIKAVVDAKPAASKGTYVKSISVATSMGPGINLDVSKVLADL
ncbi:50S ribosomal protein L1 [Candidatus Peregrinibacteria bacterium]|nr:50S ribosomal protein L1 [Candidatus Peregrinibacteria bacterium]